ncbi:alpha/beta fold hydrolase [Streptomyces decoyicus]|uniref:alpha/beta fold hydrolase n=1 Tax=Streptomyces decoyicus TaxID=249567 RepID=UPI00363E9D52
MDRADEDPVDVYGDPDAPGLVVVPGAMSDAHGWRHVAPAVGAWPSVTVVNRRGRTLSGPLTSTYSLQTEVEDLGVVLDEFKGTQALFGWSYGGLIALLTANDRPLHQVIAYEPVMRPFGSHALPDLHAAGRAPDDPMPRGLCTGAARFRESGARCGAFHFFPGTAGTHHRASRRTR